MQPATEARHPAARGLDTLPGPEVLQLIVDQQMASLATLAAALPEIGRAAELVASALCGPGRLIYAGAGSSALMACADGMELPGTYGVDPDRIVLLMAGGLPVDARMPGDTEDAVDIAFRFASGDALIAVTASGHTPFALAAVRAARAAGSAVIAIANVTDAPVFAGADAAIALPTPPEVVAGSTRMGAGTAQKAALNMISTLAGIRLGQVHDGLMVGVVADNIKLRARAAGIVAEIAAVTLPAAERALAASAGRVKPAVLAALGHTDADAILAACGDNLRAALTRLNHSGGERRATTDGRDG